MDDGALLEARDVEVAYGSVTACRGVSLSVASRQCVAVVGPNGAGKSSFVSAVAGIVPLVDGFVHFAGRDISGMAAYRRARAGLVVVPEGRQLFPGMTVVETLQISAAHGQQGTWNIPAVFELFPHLRARENEYGGNLSGGEQQMLAIARGLVLNPHLLILDEPSAGLAPRLISELVGVIRDLKESGLAVLLVEQNVYAARHLANSVVMMERGSVRASGGPELIGDDEQLRQAYLGG